LYLGEREFKSSVDHIKNLIVFFKVKIIFFQEPVENPQKSPKTKPETSKLVKTSPKTAKEPENFYDGYPLIFLFRILKILKMGVEYQINQSKQGLFDFK
jgi:hypothetical protein